MVKVGPGNLNCRAVYFAVCSSWDNGQGEKVRQSYLWFGQFSCLLLLLFRGGGRLLDMRRIMKY